MIMGIACLFMLCLSLGKAFGCMLEGGACCIAPTCICRCNSTYLTLLTYQKALEFNWLGAMSLELSGF